VTLAMMGLDLRARRRALGLTQVALAEAVGTRPVMVGRWERGEALPTIDEALRLAEALDLDPAAAAGWSAPAVSSSPDPVPAPPPGEEVPTAPTGSSLPRWLGRLTALWAARPLRRTEEERALSRERPPGESYLDDPVEQRRYALRWALTIVVLGALAIGLVWALAELWEGWGAFLDLFRDRPPGSGVTGALPHFLAG
jgi:transcriptional regulator with XRE-family HTH domain